MAPINARSIKEIDFEFYKSTLRLLKLFFVHLVELFNVVILNSFLQLLIAIKIWLLLLNPTCVRSLISIKSLAEHIRFEIELVLIV